MSEIESPVSIASEKCTDVENNEIPVAPVAQTSSAIPEIEENNSDTTPLIVPDQPVSDVDMKSAEVMAPAADPFKLPIPVAKKPAAVKLSLNSSLQLLSEYTSSDDSDDSSSQDETSSSDSSSSSDDDSDSSAMEVPSSSSSSSSSEAEEEQSISEIHKKIIDLDEEEGEGGPAKFKVPGELGLEDLPPIEDLQISVSEIECTLLGKTLSIVDQLGRGFFHLFFCFIISVIFFQLWLRPFPTLLRLISIQFSFWRRANVHSARYLTSWGLFTLPSTAFASTVTRTLLTNSSPSEWMFFVRQLRPVPILSSSQT